MKKSTLFLACCIGLMLFASCKKDPIAPTINILEEAGCVTENAQVFSGDEICIGFTGTAENLAKIDIVITKDGVVLANHSENYGDQKSDPVSPYTYKSNFVIEATGTVNIKGTVTDANGLTASKDFNINFNEKPNAKFVGHYEGEALFTGIMKADIAGLDPVEQEVTNQPFAVTVELFAGENINEVKGTCKFDGQEMEMKGTVEGNKVSFEAVNTTVTFNYDMNGFSINPEMNVTYNVTGTLDNSTLMLDGNCDGDGELHVLMYNGSISINGTIGGSLSKE